MKREARCISCGCRDSLACLMPYGGNFSGCFWVVVDHRRREGLCSGCATLRQVIYAVLARATKRKPGGGWTTEELAGWLRRTHYTVSTALQQLSRKKLVMRDGPGWKVAP